MPRIHDAFLHSIVFIYPTMQSARAGESVGGTGFLTCVRLKKNEEYSQIYGVTNKHVIKGCQTSVVLRLNSENGVEYLSTRKSDWVLHPSVYDLAVAALDIPNCNSAFKRFITDELFIDEQTIENLDIGPGDETFMVGRFVGHEGRTQNLASVRFGNISSLPNESIRADGEDMGKNFLVECRSISGYSGSPVFVWIDPNRPRPPMWMTPVAPPYNPRHYGPFLLGIDAAHIETPLEITHVSRAKILGTAGFVTAMSIVVPAWRLTEILYSDEFVDKRNREDEEITMKKNAGYVVPDSGG